MILPACLTLASSIALPAASAAWSALPEPPDLAELAPTATVVWVESTDLGPLLDQGLSHPLIARLLAEPAIAAELERSGQDPEAALAAAEGFLGAPPLEVASTLLGGGVALGLVQPDKGEPRLIALLRGRPGADMESALETVIDLGETLGAVRPVPSQERGALGSRVVDAWRFVDGSGFLALLPSDTVIFAQKPDDIAACIQAESTEAPFRSARRALPSAAAGTFLWADLDALDRDGELAELREIVTDAGAHFLLGPAFTYAGTAGEVAATLSFTPTRIEANAIALDPKPGAGIATFPAGSGRGTVPASSPTSGPDAVAHITLHRDIATLLAERVELFPPRSQPEFAEALGNLALLVGGVEAADEFVAAIEPGLTLLVEPVEFEAGVRPDVPLPSLCVVARMRDPEVNGARFVQAFQTAVALNGVERAQNGQAGFQLGIDLVGDAQLISAKLPPPAKGDGVDIAHNLSPACAVVGHQVVVGTHVDLVSKVVSRIQSETPGTAPKGHRAGTVDDLRMDGAAIADILEANRELIVMNQVLLKGKGRARAQLEVDTLGRLLRGIRSLRLTSETLGKAPRALLATLRIDLAP